MAKILIVDDEVNIRKVLRGLLNKNGFDSITQAENGKDAFDLIQEENFDLIISDLNMPVMDGMQLFEKIKNEGIPFIILTAYGSIESAVAAVKSGVYDFIAKPFDEQNLINTVNKALKESVKGSLDLKAGSAEEFFFRTENKDILKIKENLDRVVKTKAGILIIGETGTGKGVLASIIHAQSPEKNAPLIKINCAAIPENLLESELFGYAKGAFTGAVTEKPGKFEMADGGTIFLDEIGELGMDLQAKLLTAIQEKETTRLGENKPRKVDIRIIAATNADMPALIAEKKFREDLFYRLNVVEYKIPPLRERKQDIPGLADYFAAKYAKEYDNPKKSFDAEASEHLCGYAWPGNVRELENVIQKLTIMEKENVVTKENLENYIKKEDAAYESGGATLFEAGKSEKAKLEAQLIKDAIAKTGGNKTKAAELLGISRRTLLYRVKEYGL